MNGQIKQLADQCRTEYRDGHGGFTEQFDEEKFAELIVRECVEQLDDGSEENMYIRSVLFRYFGIDK